MELFTGEEIELKISSRNNSRLTSYSASVAKLVETFERREIKRTKGSESVWLSYPFFQQHTLANFRTCYYNINPRTETANCKICYVTFFQIIFLNKY